MPTPFSAASDNGPDSPSGRASGGRAVSGRAARFSGEALSFERIDDTLEVRLHREPLNEIGTAMLDELEQLVACISEGAEGARAVLIYSDRKGFCAGADLRELHAGMTDRRSRATDALKRVTDRLGPAGELVQRGAKRLASPVIRREVRRFLDRVHRVFDALDTAPLTTIAVVHGPVFGGGFELALTADVIVAEKSARFAFPELRLGLIPGFGGIPRLNRDVGNAVVRDLLLSGRSLNATRAHAVGLVSQVVPRDKGLDVARKVAAQAAKYDPTTVAAAKAFAKPLPGAELAREKDVFTQLVTRPAVYEALTAFVESEDLRPYL